MPTVPTYQRQIGPAAVPGVTQNIQMPANPLPGALAQAGATATGVGTALMRQVRVKQAEDDTYAAQTAYAGAQEALTRWQAGELPKLRGLDASTRAVQAAEGTLAATYDGAVRSLSPDAKKRFDVHWGGLRTRVIGAAAGHAAREHDAAAENAYKALRVTAVEAAAGAETEEEIQSALAPFLASMGDRLRGQAPEVVESEMDTLQSDIGTARLNRVLTDMAADQDEATVAKRRVHALEVLGEYGSVLGSDAVDAWTQRIEGRASSKTAAIEQARNEYWDDQINRGLLKMQQIGDGMSPREREFNTDMIIGQLEATPDMPPEYQLKVQRIRSLWLKETEQMVSEEGRRRQDARTHLGDTRLLDLRLRFAAGHETSDSYRRKLTELAEDETVGTLGVRGKVAGEIEQIVGGKVSELDRATATAMNGLADMNYFLNRHLERGSGNNMIDRTEDVWQAQIDAVSKNLAKGGKEAEQAIADMDALVEQRREADVLFVEAERFRQDWLRKNAKRTDVSPKEFEAALRLHLASDKAAALKVRSATAMRGVADGMGLPFTRTVLALPRAVYRAVERVRTQQ